jgi:hypothetical protein
MRARHVGLLFLPDKDLQPATIGEMELTAPTPGEATFLSVMASAAPAENRQVSAAARAKIFRR